jgi:cytochrome c-type biogenesis protein CcmH
MKLLFIIASFVFSMFCVQPVWAVVDLHEFSNDVDRKRYQSFIDEMRCPKCQNQNLSGSDSPIAVDLRNELHFMITSGRSDKEIVDFMVERYGEYILYKPRLSSSTMLLWASPVLFLAFGGGVLWLIVRRRRDVQDEAVTLSQQDEERLKALLEKRDH